MGKKDIFFRARRIYDLFLKCVSEKERKYVNMWIMVTIKLFSSDN